MLFVVFEVDIWACDFTRSPTKEESMHYNLTMLSLSFCGIPNSLRCHFGQKTGISWKAQTIINESVQAWKDDWYRSRLFIQTICCCSTIPRAWSKKWQMTSKTWKRGLIKQILCPVMVDGSMKTEWFRNDLGHKVHIGHRVGKIAKNDQP